MRIKKKWQVLPRWRDTEAGRAFATLEKTFAHTGEEVSRDKQSTVIKTSVGGHCFYVKRYSNPSGLRSWVGRARIRLEARNQLWFNETGVPSAEVVAFGEDCLAGRTLRGGLVTEERVGTKDLAWMASHHPALVKNRDWVKAVTKQLAEITRTLHDHRFCHNDLKWRNILVTQDAGNPKLYLIDCPTGQRWPRFLMKRWIIKDLACLDKVAKYHWSRTQRLRFYLQYRGADKLSREGKRLVYRVLSFFDGRE